MAGPFTTNAGFTVPNTGDLPGTWGSAALNPDFVAIDGMLCGVQVIGLSNAPVTLSAPAGFTPTPGAGPTQAQNRVLRLNGILTADVTITLPMPGEYVVENLTTGAFDVILRGATATEVIAVPQGDTVDIYNDGARVRFIGLGKVGTMEHWAGLIAMPSWVGKCTVKPYLLCDNAVYQVSDFPYLGARLLGKFGGNGVTTFCAPDMAGRVPLAYDRTGSRITVAGCGINGQTLGATNPSGLGQNQTLVTANLPPYTPSGLNAASSVTVPNAGVAGTTVGFQGGGTYFGALAGSATLSGTAAAQAWTGQAQGGISTPVSVVQPSLVTGIWVVKT